MIRPVSIDTANKKDRLKAQPTSQERIETRMQGPGRPQSRRIDQHRDPRQWYTGIYESERTARRTIGSQNEQRAHRTSRGSTHIAQPVTMGPRR
jgi:hypothetical protein